MSLNDTFNIDPIEIIKKEEMEIVEISPTSGELDHTVDDSKRIRKDLKQTLKKAQEALDVALREQATSGHPKQSEVIAKLIDSIAKLTQASIEINYKEKEFELVLNKNRSQPKSITNNNLIVTTSDLLDKILTKKKELSQ